jgi:hypothetical protein
MRPEPGSYAEALYKFRAAFLELLEEILKALPRWKIIAKLAARIKEEQE